MSESTYNIVRNIELNKAYIDDKLEQSGGEITSEVEKLLDDLEHAHIGAVEKVSKLSFVSDKLSEIKAYVDGASEYHKQQLELVKAKQKSIDNNYERIKGKIIDLMRALGQKELQVRHKKLTIVTTKSLVVESLDNALNVIPSEYKRVKVEVDKVGLKKHIEETGVSYDGVIVESNSHLRGL